MNGMLIRHGIDDGGRLTVLLSAVERIMNGDRRTGCLPVKQLDNSLFPWL